MLLSIARLTWQLQQFCRVALQTIQHHLQASLVCPTQSTLLIFLEVCCRSISVEYAALNRQQRYVFARWLVHFAEMLITVATTSQVMLAQGNLMGLCNFDNRTSRHISQSGVYRLYAQYFFCSVTGQTLQHLETLYHQVVER